MADEKREGVLVGVKEVSDSRSEQLSSLDDEAAISFAE
jgi:hypothetical protein